MINIVNLISTHIEKELISFSSGKIKHQFSFSLLLDYKFVTHNIYPFK